MSTRTQMSTARERGPRKRLTAEKKISKELEPELRKAIEAFQPQFKVK